MNVEVKRGGCGCGGCLASLFSVGLTAGIGIVVLGVLLAMPRGGSDAVLVAMAQCPAVTAAMGSPLRVSKWSMGCGEESSGGGSGNAQWTISVQGPKQGASVSYAASYLANEPWDVQRAVVSLDDGTTVTAVPCEGGGGSVPGTKPHRGGGGERDGKAGKRR